jgi:pimeloyl-ACP methyl ester carboxylesterase
METKTIIITSFGFLLATLLLLVVVSGIKFQRPALPKSTGDKYISIQGKKIRYRVFAEGEPTVILLHGFGGSLGEWKKIMPMLKSKRIIALDLPGYGGSERSADSYDLETQRQYLLSFMDALEIDRAILIGRSMGASLAAWTAANSSDQKIRGLVLIAPSAFPGSLTYPFPLNLIYKPGFANRFASVFVNNRLYRWIFPNSVAPQAISVTNSYDDKFAQAIKKILQPTLLIWSRGDAIVPFEFHTAYMERIQNLEFVEIPAAIGHSVTRNYPNETVLIINKYLARF